MVEKKEVKKENENIEKEPITDEEITDSDEEELQDAQDIIKEMIEKNQQNITDAKTPTKPPVDKTKIVSHIKKKKKITQDQLTNTNLNELNTLDIELHNIKQEIRQETITNIKEKDKIDKNIFNRNENVEINVQISNGKIIKIKPYVDQIFVVYCQGYDEVLSEPCFRYLNNLTYSQAVHFNEFLNKFGCICNDKTNHTITINDIFDSTTNKLPVHTKKFEQKYIQFYLKKINIPSVSDTILPINKEEEENDEKEEESN